MTSVIPEHPEILAVLDVREKCHAFCHSSLMALGLPYWFIVGGSRTYSPAYSLSRRVSVWPAGEG